MKLKLLLIGGALLAITAILRAQDTGYGYTGPGVIGIDPNKPDGNVTHVYSWDEWERQTRAALVSAVLVNCNSNGTFKSFIITEAAYASNSIPLWAYESNSIPGYALSTTPSNQIPTAALAFGSNSIPTYALQGGMFLMASDDGATKTETNNFIGPATITSVSVTNNAMTKLIIDAVVAVRNERGSGNNDSICVNLQTNGITVKTVTNNLRSATYFTIPITAVVTGGQAAAFPVSCTVSNSRADTDIGATLKSLTVTGAR